MGIWDRLARAGPGIARMRFSLLDWWPWRRWRVVGWVEAADEVPADLPRTAIVMVGRPGAPKWAAFDCPCRKGHRILLPLSKTVMPRWTVQGERETTLSPSVDAWHGRQRCHYFIREGRTLWVTDVPNNRQNVR